MGVFWLVKNRLSLGCILIFIGFVSSCRESPLNPHCWGALEEAYLVYPPPQVCPPYLVVQKTKQKYIIANTVPEKFLKQVGDSVRVRVKYRLVEGQPHVPPCATPQAARILCIQPSP